ncbi:ABC transporter substrate-binding protein [Acidisphaera sp. L21]|uniref:ABC transporter substrate-binding protein n=1 Tax=Acidisphaera sp. L21 TaxID=1641851 RepID=UPI00131DE8C4|nr:ABC transporter substrate-binding protein [Acidisphaera sp. L21]
MPYSRALLATALALLAASSAAAADLTPVRLASAAQVATYAAPYIALTKGYYREQGLDVSIVSFQGGGKAMEAMMGGSADAVIGSYSNTITLAARGQRVQTFINYLVCPGYVLAVGKGHPAKTLADLRGRTIGITSPGSNTQQTLNYLMKTAGFGPDEYSAVGIGNTAGAVAAVRYGKVDALILPEPIISLLENAGDVTDLLDMRSAKGSEAAMGGPYPEGSLLARTDYIDSHPKIIQALTNAVVKAMRFVATASPADVTAALPKEIVGDNPALIAESIAKIKTCYSTDGLLTPAGVQKVMDVLTTNVSELKDAKVDLSQTYTNSFVQQATP